jgi:hypothetical protein
MKTFSLTTERSAYLRVLRFGFANAIMAGVGWRVGAAVRLHWRYARFLLDRHGTYIRSMA